MNRGGGAHDARVLLLTHGVGRVLGHRDDLSGDERAGSAVRGGKGLHDAGVTGNQDLEVGIVLQRLGNALQEHRGLLVGSHDVNADGGHMPSFARVSR